MSNIDVILNEKQFAENIIESGKIDKPILAISLVSKYYRQIRNISGQHLYNVINEFMEKNFVGYNTIRWSDTINSFVRHSNKYKLSEIEYIPITKHELDTIFSIGKIKEERLLFSLLCFAKLYNEKNPKNNAWVNVDIREICKTARVSVSIDNREHILYELIRRNLIKPSSKSGNDNLKVLFVDYNNNFDVVLKINDFRELGYEYMNWKYGGYFRCARCGVLCRQNKNWTRVYCSDCAKYSPLENKSIVCVDCGKEFYVDGIVKNKNRCPECYKKYISKTNQKKYRELHPDETKTVVCVDCGKSFTINAKDNQTDRCPECYKKYRRKYWAEIKRKSRSKCPQHK